jgi:hypothetical protein
MVRPAAANTNAAISASTFSIYHMSLPPLAAQQAHSGIGNQRNAGTQQNDEKNDQQNELVTHS